VGQRLARQGGVRQRRGGSRRSSRRGRQSAFVKGRGGNRRTSRRTAVVGERQGGTAVGVRQGGTAVGVCQRRGGVWQGKAPFVKAGRQGGVRQKRRGSKALFVKARRRWSKAGRRLARQGDVCQGGAARRRSSRRGGKAVFVKAGRQGGVLQRRGSKACAGRQGGEGQQGGWCSARRLQQGE
jgi:hypothetical protein